MTDTERYAQIVERLRSGDNHVFELLYRDCYKSAAAFIKTNSGDEQDARDVFQEALLVFYKQAQKQDFQLSNEPGAYLLAVARNLWLYRLRSRRAQPETAAAAPETGDNNIEASYQEQARNEKNTTIGHLIETLKTECKELIMYAYYEQLPAAEIARRLGYTEAFVKVKKHRCMESLREKARNHPVFKDGQ